jgi:TPR repeat protein
MLARSVHAFAGLSVLLLSCSSAVPHVPGRPTRSAADWQALDQRCEAPLLSGEYLPSEPWQCHEDARCAAEVRKLRAACDRIDLIELRERCRAGNARSCFLLARIDPSQPAAVLERACALGHAVACSDLVRSQGEPARSAEATLARQCEAGAAPSCVLLARRREGIAESGVPTRYAEAASAWKAACALGSAKGCTGLAQILATHPHQLEPVDPRALDALFASQCRQGVREACSIGRRELELVRLRQDCSDGTRITSGASCLELAHRADAGEALDLLTRLCREGWHDQQLAREVPRRCEQRDDPLVAYTQSCRSGESLHCGFESLAGEALKRAAQECGAGTENQCALPGIYAWRGVAEARDPARAARLFEQGCSGRRTWGCVWVRELYADPTVLLPGQRSRTPTTRPADDRCAEQTGLDSLLPAISADGRRVALLEEDCDLADRCTSRIRVFETAHGTQTRVRVPPASALRWLRERGFRPMLRQSPPWEPSDPNGASAPASVVAIEKGTEGIEEIWLREPGPGRILLRRRLPAPLFGRAEQAGCFGSFAGISGTWFDPATHAVLVVIDFTTLPDECPNGYAYLVGRIE